MAHDKEKRLLRAITAEQDWQLALALINADTNLDYVCDEGEFALSLLIQWRHPDRLRRLEALLCAGASTETRGRCDFTALHWAATLNDLAALRVLLRWCKNVDPVTEIDTYTTPLLEAAALGYRDIVEELLKAGASKTAVNIYEQNACAVALFNGHLEVAALLE